MPIKKEISENIGKTATYSCYVDVTDRAIKAIDNEVQITFMGNPANAASIDYYRTAEKSLLSGKHIPIKEAPQFISLSSFKDKVKTLGISVADQQTLLVKFEQFTQQQKLATANLVEEKSFDHAQKMIDFKKATEKQKRAANFYLKIMIFSPNGLNNAFRLERNGDNLIIRPSTTTPPRAEDIEKLGKELVGLLERNMITFTTERTNFLGRQLVIYKVKEINSSVIDKFENDILVNIPDALLLKWHEFSSTLQAHIVECAKINLQMQLQDISATKIGETFRSPVKFDTPRRFPVYLPMPLLASGRTEKPYDLVDEVIRFKGINPENRQQFQLNEVIPATEALKEILQRAGKLSEEKQERSSLVPIG